MYEYRYSVGRYRDSQPGYHIVDISKNKLSDLSKAYSQLDIVLYDLTYKRLVKITLDDYFTVFNSYTKTIVDWLVANGNNTLNYSLTIPGNKYVYAEWVSLYHKGFFISPGNVNLSNDSQSKLTAESAPDIRITRDNYIYDEYKSLTDYSLYLMNGCFVRGVGKDNGIFIIGGGRDYQAVNQDIYVSAIDFSKIGKVKTIPITKAMVRRDEKNGYNKFLIDLDKNENLVGKTIWFVFNGQLVVDQEIIDHIGSNTLMFNPQYVDMMTHYITYKQYTRTPKWSLQSKRDKYVEDCMIEDNSFVVIIDNPSIGIEVSPLMMYEYPSSAFSNDKTVHPIMLENGLFPTTTRRQHGFNDRVIDFDIRHVYKPIIESVGNLNTDSVYDTVNSGMVGKLPDAFEFKITGITL